MDEGSKFLITSWDDGSPFDLRIAELLDRYSIKSVFYVPIINPVREVLTKKQIRLLASRFEIGSHTYSHVDLTSISVKKAKEEVLRGKEELENIIGRRVTKFCFPWGRFNKNILEIVKSAGFESARTARIFFVGGNKKGDFLENPNLHIYNHEKITYILSCLRYGDFRSLSSALALSEVGFYNVAKTFSQRKIHLWGHSWEVFEKELMEDLLNVIKYFYDGGI